MFSLKDQVQHIKMIDGDRKVLGDSNSAKCVVMELSKCTDKQRLVLTVYSGTSIYELKAFSRVFCIIKSI